MTGLAPDRQRVRKSRSKKTPEQQEEAKKKKEKAAERKAARELKEAAKVAREKDQKENQERQSEFETEVNATLQAASNVTTEIQAIFVPHDVQRLSGAFDDAKQALVKLSSEQGMKMDARDKRMLQARGESIMKDAAEVASMEDDVPAWSTDFLATIVNTQSLEGDPEGIYGEHAGNEVGGGQKKLRPGRKDITRVKNKQEAIKNGFKSVDNASKRVIELQRLENQERKKGGTPDAPEDDFIPSAELKELQDDCAEVCAALMEKMKKVHGVRVEENDPSLTEPVIQLLFFDGNKGLHFFKGGTGEAGFPMAEELFQAHVLGDTPLAGVGNESYRNVLFPQAPARESGAED